MAFGSFGHTKEQRSSCKPNNSAYNKSANKIMKEVLLCPPTKFDVTYSINPWMDTSVPVNRKKAAKEHNQLTQTYKSLGLHIREIPQEEDLPDMVFTANFGVSVDTTFIPANFKNNERKRESIVAKDYFERAGFTIAELPKDITWEGQGDFLKAGDIYIMGHGQRSDIRARGPIADILGIQEKDIVPLELKDPRYYHIDTALAPLDDKTVVINPKAFDDANLAKIRQTFSDVIETSEADNNILGCNLMVVEDKDMHTKIIVKTKGISEELKHEFSVRGYQTRDIPTEEFRKAGGSVKCLTLELYKSTPKGKVTTA